VGHDIVYRQISFSKVLLDETERISNIAVFDGKGLSALSRYNSLWRDSLGYMRWRLAAHKPIEERCRFVGHPLEIVADARKRDLDAVANYGIIIYPKNGNLIWNSYSGFDAGVYDVGSNAVVVAKNSEGVAQRADCVDHPPAAQSPIHVSAQASAAPSIHCQQSHTLVSRCAD
jgi:hypothetical protein